MASARRLLCSSRTAAALVLPLSGVCVALTLPLSKPGKALTAQEDVIIDTKQQERWVNWSNNHMYVPSETIRADNQKDVERIVSEFHDKGQKLRCVGSGLSPNGIAYGLDGSVALSLERMNHMIFVDTHSRIAKFEAGATVGQVVDELAAHGLQLENLASINLQQLGGFYQVGAHGTGGDIPPVDEQIQEMTIVTPAEGCLVLSHTQNAELFHTCKQGLGCLGIVTDFTVRCVPLHNLNEETRVMTRAEVKAHTRELVAGNKHCKYMWIPFEDKVVVITANETTANDTVIQDAHARVDALADMHDLFKRLLPNLEVPVRLNFADLRTLLLERNNLQVEHVKKVNKAEAAYHERVQGVVVKRADQTMAFDCGGQQLVLEVACKAGQGKDSADGTDVDFVLALLDKLEQENIPAPVPIEHRWTSGSSATLSPVHGPGLFGWIGIVLYMPSPMVRQPVLQEFKRYCKVVLELAEEMNLEVKTHWAKLEVPENEKDLDKLRAKLEGQYDLETFRRVKKRLDPKNILGSPFTDALLSSRE